MSCTDNITWLYVPGDRPTRIRKAYKSGADVVIIDLEDAVSNENKSAARRETITFLGEVEADRGDAPEVHVRVNALDSFAGRGDIVALAAMPRLTGIRIPKVSSAQMVHEASTLLGDSTAEIHCLIESASGVERLAEIVGTQKIAGISLGEADLIAELRLGGEQDLFAIRSRLVVAAAAGGLRPPIMSAFTNIRDLDALEASCRLGLAQGFSGRTAIHPDQLPVINRAFAPSPSEELRARAIVSAYEQNQLSAFSLADGTFVDPPVLCAAQRTLDRVEKTRTT